MLKMKGCKKQMMMEREGPKKHCKKQAQWKNQEWRKHHTLNNKQTACFLFASFSFIAMTTWAVFNLVFFYAQFFITKFHHAKLDSLESVGHVDPEAAPVQMVREPAPAVLHRAEPVEERKEEPVPAPAYAINAPAPSQEPAQQPQQYVIPITQEQLDQILRQQHA